MKGILFVGITLFLLIGSVFSHGGRTNGEGCHNDRKNGGYHCHNGGYVPTRKIYYNNSPVLPVYTEPSCSVKYPGTIKRGNKCVCPGDGSLSTYHPISGCFKYNNLTTKKITSQKPKSTKKTATKKPVPKSNINLNQNIADPYGIPFIYDNNLTYCNQYPGTINNGNKCLCPGDKNGISSWKNETYCEKINIKSNANNVNLVLVQPTEPIQQNKKIEIGNMINGKREGKRTITDQYGYKEEGNYSDNVKTGKWVYTNPNGTQREGIYEGDSKNMKSNTNTILNKQDSEFFSNNKDFGTKPFGNIINGKKDGYRILTGSEGEIQQGNYINDKQEGAWTFTYLDGRIYKVQYNNGVLIEKTLSR